MKTRVLWIPAVFIVVGIVFLASFGRYLRHWSAQPLPLTAPADLVIHEGMSFSAVARSLDAAGVVDGYLFSLLAKQWGAETSVQSGEYQVVPGETADALLRRLLAGDVVLHRFRIVEGSRVEQVLERLAEDERLAFDLVAATPDDLMVRLGLPARNAEGLFFPDTYLFARGYKASALLRQARRKMQEVLEAAWQRRSDAVNYAGQYEALIVASMVEKETARQEDRHRVAGVFVRRLAKDMRLQSDPTVIYGLGEAFDGDLTRAHLRADGPYNTYRNEGLPPTPIGLPSRDSIEAALQPDDGDALYFVARGDGGSEFSNTLADHNAAVRRFQLR